MAYGSRREDDYEDEYEHEHNRRHEHSKKVKETCKIEANEDISISVPVSIHAHVDTNEIKLKCKGHEIIKDHHCKPNSKRFIIRQKVHACIPIDFVTECEVGEGHVEFEYAE